MKETILHKDLSETQSVQYFPFKDSTPRLEEGVKIGPFTVLKINDLTEEAAKMTDDYYVANKVYELNVWNEKTSSEQVVVCKIGQPGIEQSERTITYPGGMLGGWLRQKLYNEMLIMQLAYKNDLPCPSPLYFAQEGDVEILVEKKLFGESCLALRDAEIQQVDRDDLEISKGILLAKLNLIDVSDRLFGPLNKDSMHFPKWLSYFNYKLSGTLSQLYGMYDQLSSLGNFHILATSEKEWQQKIENLETMYLNEKVQLLIEQDGKPTLTHGDYWDANLIADIDNGKWDVSLFDFERGDISGKSVDLALWLEWKIGGDQTDPDPLDNSRNFLLGYRHAGGDISPNIRELTVMYSLWQYLEFLVCDVLYGLDRTQESAYEVQKLTKLLENIVN